MFSLSLFIPVTNHERGALEPSEHVQIAQAGPANKHRCNDTPLIAFFLNTTFEHHGKSIIFSLQSAAPRSVGLVCSGCLQIKCGDGTKCDRLAPQWESHLNNLSGPIVETQLHHGLTLTAAAAKVKFQCLANSCNQNRPKSLTDEIDWDV